MSKFGNIPSPFDGSLGQDDDDTKLKSCCLNETVRFDLTLVYKDGVLVQIPYRLNYAAYLKCIKKCPDESFETSDNAGAPTPRDGEVAIWATWKQSQECTICPPKIKLNQRVAQCGTKGDHLFGGVQTPPITNDEIRIINDFIIEMGNDPPNEDNIKALMTEFMETVCKPRAKCTKALKKLCRTGDPPPK